MDNQQPQGITRKVIRTARLNPGQLDDFIGDRYLVEEISIDQTVYPEGSEKGIVLPSQDKERYWSGGLVIKVGDGRWLDKEGRSEMTYSVEDLIIYERLVGRSLVLAGKEYRVIPQSSVFFKIRKDDLSKKPEA